MRPRPFKYFFGVAIAVMLFFFLARVFFAALIFAAIASTVYYIFRGIGNFFRRMNWQEEEYDFRREYAMNRGGMDWRENEVEPLFETDNRSFQNFNRQERIIRVR